MAFYPVDSKVYTMPISLPEFQKKWWTVEDAMKAWKVSETYADLAFLGFYGDLHVTEVVCRYPGAMMVLRCIKAGTEMPGELRAELNSQTTKPRRKNPAAGGADAQRPCHLPQGTSRRSG